MYSQVDAHTLPARCPVKELWVKSWMLNHDSLNLYDQLSLDHSSDQLNEDQVRHQLEEELYMERHPQDIKCGLYCCQDPPLPLPSAKA